MGGFIRKSLSKVHGCYEAISGGYIKEALIDLTGAPCEVIDFTDNGFVRLLSFKSCHHPMGCAAYNTGEGIVGCHAYSILNCEMNTKSILLGKQTRFYSLLPHRLHHRVKIL